MPVPLRTVIALIFVFACGPAADDSDPLTSDQRRRADQMISVFENDTIENFQAEKIVRVVRSLSNE